jgi:hypothetical protein
MSDWGGLVLFALLTICALSVLGLFLALILVIPESTRRLAGRIALVSGIALIVSAGVCFAAIPLMEG